jgi:hypothetical protein
VKFRINELKVKMKLFQEIGAFVVVISQCFIGLGYGGDFY